VGKVGCGADASGFGRMYAQNSLLSLLFIPGFFLQSLIGSSVPSVRMLLIRCILGVKSSRNMISMALLLVE
jgi:hypothetical protein